MCPRIFHIYGPLWVNGYGLMIAVGFLFFSFFAYSHPWRKKNVSSEDFLSFLFFGFLSAVVGGRLLYVIYEPPKTLNQLIEVFSPWVGGFSLFGSIIAVLICVPIFLRVKRIKILRFFDVIALYTPLMLTFSRIGCFLAGCCHGAVAKNSACWTVKFTDPHSLAPLNTPLYPTQLYSSLASFIIFMILLVVEKKAKKLPGTIIMLFLMLESVSRFAIDFFRGDREVGFITSMQWIVVAVFVGALLGFIFIRRAKNVDF